MTKKLLLIIHSLIRGGGAERVVSTLTIHLSKKYQINILTIHDYKNLYPYLGNYYSLKENIGLRRKILSSLKVYTIIRPFKIYKLIRQISPDIILSNVDLTNIYTIQSKLLFRFKIPLILSVHTNPKIAYKKGKSYISILLKVFYSSKLVNKIVTVSKGVKKILENDYKIKSNKLKTIYNAVDTEKINNMKNEKISDHKDLFYNEDIIKFVTIGRLTDLKGHKYLIDAFFQVKKEIANSKLIVIGEGSLKRQLEKKIKDMGLDNEVFLLGFKRNPYKYLTKSNIFVLSSKHEGFPTVLLEALSCGLPIISTDCETGPREILDNGKYGLLVNVSDVEDLKNAMILLARNNDLRDQFSKLSTERAKFFNIKKCLIKWIDLIENEIKVNN